jgi:hypothetical protein
MPEWLNPRVGLGKSWLESFRTDKPYIKGLQGLAPMV